MGRQYITTAIDFPNAEPHMGHAYEKILADVLVRWLRLRGENVRFQIGTDEYGIKIQQTAKAENCTPRELIDKNAPLFEKLFQKLNISYDVFVRTANEKKHWPTVTELWKRLQRKGMLEKRSYTGMYCTGCEKFVTEKDLIDGKCPDHDKAPEKVTEENWFFRLSTMQKDIEKLLSGEVNRYQIIPAFRGNETRAFLAKGLEDISFSRSKKTLQWGVPVPDDDSQVMYVWCDNLTSYLSGIGYFTHHAEAEWWDDARVTHIIGKDIARFHALNWPSMLLSANVRPPDQLIVHGFITHEGKKMSKTLGNVVSPKEILDWYESNPDPLRFFLLHEIPVGNDGDFSWERLKNTYDGILRNQIGNLLNRVLILLSKEGGEISANIRNGTYNQPAFLPTKNHKEWWTQYKKNMDAFEYHNALHQDIMKTINDGNIAMQTLAPWTLQDNPAKKRETLSEFAEMLRHLALMLLPFMPETAQRISLQLNVPYASHMGEKSFTLTDSMQQWGSQKDWTCVGSPDILFPPLKTEERENP